MKVTNRYIDRNVYTVGRSKSIGKVVAHWYNSPDKAGTYENTVDWLLKKAPVSIHYVVSGRKITRMVREKDTAWHAGGKANPISIGIEFDPNNYNEDFAAEVIAWICKRHKLNPLKALKGHKYYMNTTCPGFINIKNLAKKADIIIKGVTMDKKDLDKLHQLTFHRKVGKDAGGQNYLNKYSGSKLSTVLDYLLSHASYKSLVKRNVDYTRLERDAIDLSQEVSLLKRETRITRAVLEDANEANEDLTKQQKNLEDEVDRLEQANTKLNEENIRIKKGRIKREVTIKQAISVIIDKIVSLIRR